MTQPIALTDEQREFRDVVRQFAADKIAPLAADTDRNAEYSWPAFEALRSMELTALSYPEEYGGSGASLVDQAIVVEEIAAACASTSLMLLISKLGMLPVLNFGSEETKRRYLPEIAAGTSQASYGLSEADAGSDVASMTTRAVADGDEWVINGSKCWITNAGISDLYTVFARTSEDRHTGLTAFLVEAEWGVHVDKLEHKLGIKGSPTGVIRLEETRVPDANRLGEVGQGFEVAMHTLDRSRPTIGAQAIGIARGALDYAIGYMRERTTFGRPIGDNQGCSGWSPTRRRRSRPRAAWCTGRVRSSTRVIRTANSRWPAPWPRRSPRTSRWRSPPTACSSSAATATRTSSPSSG